MHLHERRKHTALLGQAVKRMACALIGVLTLMTSSLLAWAEPEQATSPRLRIAAIQMEITGTIHSNLKRISQGIAEASKAGARVAVFPETALSGFTQETIEKLSWKDVESAMASVADAARKAEMYVIYGCATQSSTNKPFNSALVIGPDGKELFRYHKMFPESWFTPGDRLALFAIDGIPCTLMICHDERFPELTRIPALGGAKLCFYISFEINSVKNAMLKKEGYRAQLIARAVENNVWVIQSNGVGPLSSSTHVSLGNSRIVNPQGVVLQEAPALKEHLLVENIDVNTATRGNALETMDSAFLTPWWRAGLNLLEMNKRSSMPAPTRNTLRLALMQGAPRKWALEENFAVFLEQVEAASKEKADMLVTPECWLDGYAAPDKASTPERLRTVAQDPASSVYIARVAEEAKRRSMFICFGFTSLEQGVLYNAAGLWNADGSLIGIYHKTHLQTHDLQFSPGEALPVWPTPWGPVGIMICADRRWPETARTLRLQGARLILNPSYGMHGENNEMWMRTRGYENQCFIAFTHPEVGLVVNPKGGIAAKRESERPGLLVCDIDLLQSKEDNHLEDRRPELYAPLISPAVWPARSSNTSDR
ncbi:MAG TPA: carbon-nitrogen hydrolase family protein [Candidatus Hydrogenedentes bacterium]|nr:carbon-nitrogen hydrolase family protein [Candidatus Hydrogenedentota bacterium]